MGKQQKKITWRKSRPQQPEPEPTTDDLARDLVRRGLASRSILELRHTTKDN